MINRRSFEPNVTTFFINCQYIKIFILASSEYTCYTENSYSTIYMEVRMQTRYELRYPRNLSATSISQFSDCEQRFAYQWIFVDVPITPDHVSLVYGSAMHAMAQHTWNQKLGGGTFTSDIVKYCHAFVVGALNGKHGPRTSSEPPQPIRWLSFVDEVRLSPQEKEAKIAEKKQEYIAKAFFALKAIYLECAEPSPFVRTEIEYSFRRKRITLPVLDGDLPFPLLGVIDRVQFLPSNDYVLVDYKTGATSSYQRNKLVRDIQMTIYQYAGELIWDRPPIDIFIQPLEVPKETLETYGPKTLEHLRTRVPVRTDPVHFEGIKSIARDILSVVGHLLYPARHTKEEREAWQPISEWGKMAAFTDNMKQDRFVPRIGTWCAVCPFSKTCCADNLADWKLWEESRGNDAFGENVESSSTVAAKQELPVQETLFGEKIYRRAYSKSEREIRKEMLTSGNFYHAKNVAARLKEMHRILKNGSTPCPCVRLNLIPLPFLELLPQFLCDKGKRRSARKITAKQLGEACPYENCPHREKIAAIE